MKNIQSILIIVVILIFSCFKTSGSEYWDLGYRKKNEKKKKKILEMNSLEAYKLLLGSELMNPLSYMVKKVASDYSRKNNSYDKKETKKDREKEEIREMVNLLESSWKWIEKKNKDEKEVPKDLKRFLLAVARSDQNLRKLVWQKDYKILTIDYIVNILLFLSNEKKLVEIIFNEKNEIENSSWHSFKSLYKSFSRYEKYYNQKTRKTRKTEIFDKVLRRNQDIAFRPHSAFNKKEVLYCELYANQGTALDHYKFGLMHSKGIGVNQNDKEALKWYIRSAKGGNSQAQYEIGRFYEKGISVRKNYNQAVKWYRASMKSRNSSALNRLGRLYEEGMGVRQDNKDAFECYLESAHKGNSQAEYNTGRCYEKGIGVSRNFEKAVEWYLKSAKKGNLRALNRLGQAFENGDLELAKDRDEAIKYYLKGSLRGSAIAKVCIGKMYEEGNGVNQSNERSIQWYEKATRDGSVEGLYRLGRMYSEGKIHNDEVIDCKKSKKKKKKRKREEKKEETSQVENQIEAIKYLSLAYRKNHQEAKLTLNEAINILIKYLPLEKSKHCYSCGGRFKEIDNFLLNTSCGHLFHQNCGELQKLGKLLDPCLCLSKKSEKSEKSRKSEILKFLSPELGEWVSSQK